MLKFAVAFLLLAAVFASDVVELGDGDFASTMAGYELALVKFYAPWCGHCKKLAPEFDSASAVLKANDPPVALVKVDCTAEGKDVCSKYEVSGFPTLKAFKHGEVAFDYNGPRDSDGIIKYMRSKAGPSSKVLKSVADAKKFVDNDEHVIVGFFKESDSDVAKQFQKTADALNEDFRFAYSTDADVLKEYDYSDNIVMFHPKRLHSKFEDAQQKYDGDASLQKIKTWVNDNIHGLCGHRTTSNQAQFKMPLVVAYYDVDYVKNTKGTNYWRNRVSKVAKKLKDEGLNVNFAVSSKDDFNFELNEYGMSTSGDKPVIAARNAAEQKFVMSEEFSMESLEQFVRDMLADKLKPHLKSEPIPESNDAPVKVAVAENFDELINDESKDVLIEFYAPWCGHCKTLAPKYEELAEMLAGEDEIVIAKMDATANDVPKAYEVRGFPTIFFAPRNSKKNPKKFEGGREVKDFITYLAKESTNPLKGYDRDGKKKKTEL